MDLIIEKIFKEEMKGDTSFQEKPSGLEILFGRHKSKHQTELRETWDSGIKHGIEIGMRRTSLEGQKLELYGNTLKPEHKEFLDKFYELANEYGCAIQYHPEHGMIVVNKG